MLYTKVAEVFISVAGGRKIYVEKIRGDMITYGIPKKN
jgi:hypothetical protein